MMAVRVRSPAPMRQADALGWGKGASERELGVGVGRFPPT